MPPDERITKSAERCDLHAGIPSVARCVGCDRPMCLACTVPVRGETYGAECLPSALGESLVVGEVAPARRRRGGAPAGLGFAVALLATALPWSRFGEGSGPFGAWGLTARWSVLAAVAAAVGLAAWVLRRPPAGLLIPAAAIVAASALAIAHPPSFTHAAAGGWVAATGGTVALAAGLWEALTRPAGGR